MATEEITLEETEEIANRRSVLKEKGPKPRRPRPPTLEDIEKSAMFISLPVKDQVRVYDRWKHDVMERLEDPTEKALLDSFVRGRVQETLESRGIRGEAAQSMKQRFLSGKADIVRSIHGTAAQMARIAATDLANVFPGTNEKETTIARSNQRWIREIDEQLDDLRGELKSEFDKPGKGNNRAPEIIKSMRALEEKKKPLEAVLKPILEKTKEEGKAAGFVTAFAGNQELAAEKAKIALQRIQNRFRKSAKFPEEHPYIDAVASGAGDLPLMIAQSMLRAPGMVTLAMQMGQRAEDEAREIHPELTDEEAFAIRSVSGATQAGLERMGIDVALQRLFGGAAGLTGGQIASRIATKRGALKSAAISGGVEAGTEPVQSILNGEIIQAVTGEEVDTLFTWEAFKDRTVDAFAGFFLGAPLGAIGDGSIGKAIRKLADPLNKKAGKAIPEDRTPMADPEGPQTAPLLTPEEAANPAGVSTPEAPATSLPPDPGPGPIAAPPAETAILPTSEEADVPRGTDELPATSPDDIGIPISEEPTGPPLEPRQVFRQVRKAVEGVPRVRATTVQRKKGSGVTFTPSGDIQFNLTPSDIQGRGDDSRFVMDEEVTHLAEVLGARDEWEAGGKKEKFTDFLDKRAREHAAGIDKELLDLRSEDRKTAARSLAESIRAYTRAGEDQNVDFARLEQIAETGSVADVLSAARASGVIGSDAAIYSEWLRQTDQIERTGTTTELAGEADAGVFARLKDSIREAIRQAVAWIDRGRSVLRKSPTFAGDIDAITRKRQELSLPALSRPQTTQQTPPVEETPRTPDPAKREEFLALSDEKKKNLATNIDRFGWVPEEEGMTRQEFEELVRPSRERGEAREAETIQREQENERVLAEAKTAPRKISSVSRSELNKSSDLSDDGYYYHITTNSAAPRILESQQISSSGTQSMAPGFYADYSKGKVFLTDRGGVEFWNNRIQEHLESQERPTGTTILRIPKTAVPEVEIDAIGTRDANSPSWFVPGALRIGEKRTPPEVVERQGTEGMPAEEAARVHRASDPPPTPPLRPIPEPGEGFVVGPRKSKIDEEREAWDLSPRDEFMSKTFKGEWPLAKERNMDGVEGSRLVNDLLENPRPITEEEIATLAHEMVRRRHELDRAMVDVNDPTKSEFQRKLSFNKFREAQVAYNRLADAIQNSSSRLGRAFNFLKMLADDQFNLVTLKRTRQAGINGGDPLTPKQEKQIEGFYNRVQKLFRDLETAKNRRDSKTTNKAGREAAQKDIENIEFALAKEITKQLEKDNIERFKRLNAGMMTLAVATEIMNLPRALLTTVDFSASLRQGGIVAVSHPVLASQAFEAQMKAFASERGEFEVMQGIRNDPLHSVMVADGNLLYIGETTLAVTLDQEQKARDEAYRSFLSTKIPGVKNFGRGYQTFLNKLRWDYYKDLVNKLAAATPEQRNGLAKWVNITTGRGGPGDMGEVAGFLGAVFFAPRWVASRFQYLATIPTIWTYPKGVRGLIAQEIGRQLLGFGTIISGFLLAKEAFDDDDEWGVEFDTRSSDFLKLRIGNTRHDFMAGLTQNIVMGSRVIRGQLKSPSTGEVKDADSWRTAATFLRTKLSPVAGTSFNVLSGKNVINQPAGLLDMEEIPFITNLTGTRAPSPLVNLFIPLTFGEISDAIEEQGLPVAIASSLATLLGAAGQTYEPGEGFGKTEGGARVLVEEYGFAGLIEELYTRSTEEGRLLLRAFEEGKPAMIEGLYPRLTPEEAGNPFGTTNEPANPFGTPRS